MSLIIQAAALTEGGDIFMLDMGQRIRIDDLARRLIRLRGLRPPPPAGEQGSRGAEEQRRVHPSTSAPPHPCTGDIPIVYTGVRPGEKMHEELLGDGELREPTSHPHTLYERGLDRKKKSKYNWSTVSAGGERRCRLPYPKP